MRTTWRQMAQQLASRLEHHAHCGNHPLRDQQPDDCPHCHDRAVWRTWQQMERRAGSPLTRGQGGNL